MNGLFRDVLPEFLGSLAAALVIAGATWATRRVRSSWRSAGEQTTTEE
ncbi:hypothetical protein SSAG_04299 [Streptomyces sp. Mg1]|nr:hypothetical protein SSAG_04299 [Streptomyces sp. Mg1]